MKLFQKKSKPLCIFLAMSLFFLFVPYQRALAGLVGTEAVLEPSQAQEVRDSLIRLMSRENVQSALISQGIEPAEARARVASLSEAEAAKVAEMMENLPAGGGFFETLGILVVIAFCVLIITDLLGLTNIFPFINPPQK
jgi:hypothetical protein